MKALLINRVVAMAKCGNCGKEMPLFLQLDLSQLPIASSEPSKMFPVHRNFSVDAVY